ncbi:hypothetical protein HAZT_HAZT011215 [Hyalella azteca]|uniref:PPM-type phosphatase domain-containing protein n=1 Tax=Hyalella azteca TaxID=294128 RepID=A0A6A0H4M9_HYAAZ|nr:hypothetical protein HAZT_HAZT011215 [Hyalella azteca]
MEEQNDVIVCLQDHLKNCEETSVCEGGGFKVAASSMQGWRVTMEDAHTTLPVMPGDPKTAFFAVFDGHGGQWD